MAAFIDYSSLTALVIDDKKPFHRLMEAILYKFGFRRVLNAFDGFEAEQALLNDGNSIDIVFCDLRMPHKDGIAFIKDIRQSRFKDLPVVVVTGHGDRDVLIEAMDLGIEGFLVKPVSPDLLAAHIGSALQRRRIEPVVFWMNERIADYLEDDSADKKIRPIEWSADISIGHGTFDKEHKGVIELIDRLLDALEGVTEPQTAALAYRELMRETVSHFRLEEDQMRVSEYPNTKAHKREHDDFLERIGVLFQNYETGEAGSTSEFVKFLTSWWVAHIIYADKKLAVYLKTKPV